LFLGILEDIFSLLLNALIGISFAVLNGNLSLPSWPHHFCKI